MLRATVSRNLTADLSTVYRPVFAVVILVCYRLGLIPEGVLVYLISRRNVVSVT